jgi:hypothetical protein
MIPGATSCTANNDQAKETIRESSALCLVQQSQQPQSYKFSAFTGLGVRIG